MQEVDDKSRGTNSQAADYKLEVAGLDVPKAKVGLKRLRKPRNLPLTERPLFMNNPLERMATGAPVISATQAYLKSSDWGEYEKDSRYFQKMFGSGRSIEFYILNQQKHQPEFITCQAEPEILKQYGAMAALLHVVFASYAVRQTEPWKEPFYLLGTDLLKTLGVYNTKKLTKSQKLKGIADLACVVGTLGAVIHWYEGHLDLCVRERGLLWIVNVQEYGQPNLLGEADELYEVVIRVQPGLWTHNFLNQEGERQRKALYQYGFIPKGLFDINPHRQKLAASLALYIIQNSRAHKSGLYTIESLLANVLPKADINHAIKDRRYGWKLKDSVDNALLVLRDALSLGIEFDDETYPRWLKPVWSQPDDLAELPTKERNQRLLGSKWLPDNYIQNHWFPAKLAFKLPALIQQRLHEFMAGNDETAKRISLRSVKKAPQSTELGASQSVKTPPQTKKFSHLTQVSESGELTGAAVRQARLAIGMSQRDVARAMDMSQSWVRDIEKDGGQKPIPLQHALKLREVLGIA